MNVDELLKLLFNLKYNEDCFEFEVISKKNRPQVEAKVKLWWSQQTTETARKIAELEAKCFAYEAIIKNSNFAPMLCEKSEVIESCST